MEWKTFIDGIVVGFLASVSLGPIGVLCIQRTLQRGRLSGFVSGMGAVFSDTIYAVIAGFSISYIVSFIEKQFIWINIFGAIILIIFGATIYRSNPAVQLRRQKNKKGNLIQDFVSTFLLTISNPVALFIFIAFFTSFSVVQPSSGLIDQLILIAGVFAGATIWWLLLTTILGLFRSKVNLRRLFWINKIAGATIIVSVIIYLSIVIIQEYLW